MIGSAPARQSVHSDTAVSKVCSGSSSSDSRVKQWTFSRNFPSRNFPFPGRSRTASKIRSKAEPVNISRGMDPAAAASAAAAAGALGFPQALAAAAQAAAQAAAHAAQTRLDQRSQVRDPVTDR